MQRRLNRKLLIGTAVALGVVAAAGSAWYQFQSKRNAGALKEQAERALAQGQLVQAVRYLNHYLSFEPGDTDALAEYGTALDRVAKTPQARWRTFLVLDQVLRREPDRHELRRRLVQIAIELRRFSEAIRHLELLAAVPAPRAEDIHLLACCQEAQGDLERAVAAFRRVIALKADHLESYVLLAELYQQRLDQPAEAAALVEEMSRANPTSVTAHHYRARYHANYGALEAAAKTIEAALDLEPGNADVLFTAAEIAVARRQFLDARRFLRRRVESHPHNERHHLDCAALEERLGDSRAAIDRLEEGLKKLPESAALRARRTYLLLESGADEPARSELARLKQNKALPAVVELLEARLRQRDGDWLEAGRQLEQLARQARFPQKWSGPLAAALGNYYHELGETEAALAAFRRAVELDPANRAACLHNIEGLLASGQIGEAVTAARSLCREPAPPARAWLLLARALLERNRHRHEARREWIEIEQCLAKAGPAGADGVEIAILQADVLLARGQAEPAQKALEKARSAQPRELCLRLAQAELLQRLGQHEPALAVLEQALRELGDSAELRLARIGFWTQRGGIDAHAALKRLAREPLEFSHTAQIRVLRRLAVLFSHLGDTEEAGRAWQALAQLQPRDLASRFWLYEQALARGDEQHAARLLDELRRIEGDDGVLWRAAQVQRLLRAPDGGYSRSSAQKLLREIQARQRDWPYLAMLEGRLEEAAGQHDRALDSYLRALDLGERQPAQVLRVTRLLVHRLRYADAERAFRLLDEYLALNAELARLGSEIALGNRDGGRALQRARLAVPETSRDYRDLLWLARVAQRAGYRKEAAAALQRARAMAPSNPDVWLALVAHETQSADPTLAAAVLEEARRHVPPDRWPLLWARGLEVLGEAERAEVAYRDALSDQPEVFLGFAELADFYLRGDRFDEAEPWLRRLLEPEARAPAAQAARARRLLALGLARRGSPSDLRAARELLGENRTALGRTLADERALAFVLAAEPASRAQALRAIDDSLARQPLTPDEQFHFVLLCESLGAQARADEWMQDLIAKHGDRPQFLAQHIRMLVRRGDHEQARRGFERLLRLDPSSPRTRELGRQLKLL